MAKTMTKKKREDRVADGPSFEKGIARLEQIVELLDDGNLPLDQSLALFKEGTMLAKSCRSLLAAAEVQVKKALEDAENGAARERDGGDPDDEEDLEDEAPAEGDEDLDEFDEDDDEEAEDENDHM